MASLTPRQETILHYRAHGYGNKEITKLMWISLGTVKMQSASIFQRLGAQNMCDAIRIAYERGILPLAKEEEGVA